MGNEKIDDKKRKWDAGGGGVVRDSSKEKYDYASSWKKYAYEEEEPRFLSSEREDLLKICECIDLRKRKREKTSGGIPICYEDGKLYVLKEGPHTRVEGESGSKKSRTVCRGAAVSAMLNRDSFIIIDPKGEISTDPKIQYMLRKCSYDAHVLDLRTYDKDGFNLLSYIADMKKKGKDEKAMDAINRFVGMLAASKKTEDDFWNDQGGELIRSAMQFTLAALAENNRLEDYHLAAIKSYIRQDKDGLQEMIGCLLTEIPYSGFYNPFRTYADILSNPEKTYSCIVSSANALLSAFCSSEALLKMLSIKTFDIRKFYEVPSALFVVVPDETNAYDAAAGYLIDILYQILVEEFGEYYQNRDAAPCNIKFICDEIAAVRVNDMGSKISASRSRQMDWTLIYQSDKQMQQAYKGDFGAICGNCKNYIFLGSSDHEILKTVSAQTGQTWITPNGRPFPMVTVEDLRKMKKRREYKDALIMRGNVIYCAKLPDYDSFPFLKKEKTFVWKNHIEDTRISVYSLEDLLNDFQQGKITLDFGSGERRKMPEKCDETANQKQRAYEEERIDIQKEWDMTLNSLFGVLDNSTE